MASGRVIPFNYKFQADFIVTMILELPNSGCSKVAKEEYWRFGPEAIKSIPIGAEGTLKVCGKGWLLYS